MKHPEAVLLPFLMFADYFLTVAGAIQRDKRYSEHFKIPQYELNPLWQKQIARKAWFNPRHAVLTLLLSGLLIFLSEFGNAPSDLLTGMIGCLLVLYSMILGRHISNLFIFRHVIRNPDDLSGELTMTHPFTLSLSMYHCLQVLFPLALIAFFLRSPFATGGVIGVALFQALHLVWMRKARKQCPPLLKAGEKPARATNAAG